MSIERERMTKVEILIEREGNREREREGKRGRERVTIEFFKQ